jgi:hypothetical protein
MNPATANMIIKTGKNTTKIPAKTSPTRTTAPMVTTIPIIAGKNLKAKKIRNIAPSTDKKFIFSPPF